MSGKKGLPTAAKVGIIGCGHLGQAVAQSLISGGLAKQNLLISYRGNPETYQRLEERGMAGCLTTNERVFGEADIVLLTIRPQDLSALKGIAVPEKTMIVSCLVGVPLELLSGIFGKRVFRMMLSGPDTLVSGKGVAATYPENGQLRRLVELMGAAYIKTETENDIDVFTAGVCLTAAILKAGNPDEQKKAIARIRSEYPLIAELYSWAVDALPDFRGDAEKKGYIAKMITKGGVTETIVSSLGDGCALDDALKKGIERTKEISAEIRQSIAGAIK